ncbi:hypothetical protein [Acinetobacter baumannii]|uniref:hypothetical protein n=1 Tax=Acinetobacter baumannii TaxID=470 RepID=UPI003B428E61
MDYILMLYMDWFIILLLAYMAAGLATFMVIGFVPVGRRKRLASILQPIRSMIFIVHFPFGRSF